MSKRKRFLITSFLLSLGFIGIQFLPQSNKIYSIFFLGLLSIPLFSWSLWEGLGFNMTLLSLVMPPFYTVGVGLFWFLLPANIYIQASIAFLYGIGIYALCLTTNIYTVSAIRTIALLRAARGVGFVLTIFVFFLIFDAIFSLRQPVFYNLPLVALSSFPLFFQGFWSIPLEKGISTELIKISVVSTLVVSEVSAILFFWPSTVAVTSLFLTSTSYLLLGLGQSHLEGRLFPRTIKEYFFIGFLLLFGLFLATEWGR